MLTHSAYTSRDWHRALSRLVLGLGCLLALMVRGLNAQPHVRIMTYNIAGGLVPESAPLAVMQQHQPDILLLQEVHGQAHVARLGQQLRLPYSHFAPYQGRKRGIAILSRWPLGEIQRLPWRDSPQGKLALAAQIASPAGTFWACSVHLDNPLVRRTALSFWHKAVLLWDELFTTTRRSQQAQALRAWFSPLGEHTGIIGGDFNSLPFAGADRHLRHSFDDALSIHREQYFTGTYWGPPSSPIVPRIDFLYHAPEWQVIDAQVIQQKASDHFPILAVLARKTPVPSRAMPQHTTRTTRRPGHPLLSASGHPERG